MNIYTLPDGTTVRATDQFQIGDQRYPSGWLATAPASDIAAVGITVTAVPDPVLPPQTLVVTALAFRQLFTASDHIRAKCTGY